MYLSGLEMLEKKKKGIKNNPLLNNFSIRCRQVVLMLWLMIIFDFYGGLQFTSEQQQPLFFPP